MGACCVSDTKTHNQKRTSEFQGKKISEVKVNDVHNESQSSKANNMKPNINEKEDQILNYISQGSLHKIEELVGRGEINVNEYIFGGTETILHKAVCIGNSHKIVEYLLDRGANVNSVEMMTKNTSLFFACVDLKVEMVEVILNQNPDLEHKNENGETALEHLENFYFPKKKGETGKTITPEGKKKYDAIIDRIEAQKKKMKYTEKLD